MTKRPQKQSTNPPQLGRHGRAVGLDVHPDSFAAAILQGRDPLNARVLQSITRQPLAALGAWAERHTTAADVLLIEASANTFAIAERLRALGRQVIVLESHRAGQIGKSYLAMTSSMPRRSPVSILAAWRSKSGNPTPRRDSAASYSRPINVA